MHELRQVVGEQEAHQRLLWQEDQENVAGLTNMAVFVCVLGLLSMVLIGCFLSSVHARNISHPIEQLAASAKTFAADRRVLIPIDPSKIDEINILTRELNSMQSEIRATHNAERERIRKTGKIQILDSLPLKP